MVACVAQESAPWPGADAWIGAKSVVLFSVGASVTHLDVVQDQADGLQSVAPATGDTILGRELWTYSCDGRQLGLTSDSYSTPTLSTQGGCSTRNAPCPLRRLGLEPGGSEWTSLPEAGEQPWPGLRPNGCDRFSISNQQLLEDLQLGSAGTFVAAIDEEYFLLGAMVDVRLPSAHGELQLWRLSDQGDALELRKVATSTTTQLPFAGHRLPSGAILVAQNNGDLLRVVADGTGLSITPELGVPLDSSPCSAATTAGRALAGGATPDGYELFHTDGCGSLWRQVDGGPWAKIWVGDHGTEPELVWVGPGEVYAAGIVESGFVHVVAGQAKQERVLDAPGRVDHVGAGELGRFYFNVGDEAAGSLYVLEGGEWRLLFQSLLGAYVAFLAIGDTTVAATGSIGYIEQLSASVRCDSEYRPPFQPGYLGRQLLRMGNQLLILGYLSLDRPGPQAVLSAFQIEERVPCDRLPSL